MTPAAPVTEDVHVVLIDDRGRVVGTMPKAIAHHRATPLHLAFSCHIVDSRGRVLLARRSPVKQTWPSTWSNACCGHPQLGETLRQAVARRLDEELGIAPRRMGIAIADFAYRAVMADGTAEHELCPVVVALADDEPVPDPAEVDTVAWSTWDELQHRAVCQPDSLSPWSVQQVMHLAQLAPTASMLLDLAHRSAGVLDRPVGDPYAGDTTDRQVQEAMGVASAPVEGKLRTFVGARRGAVAALDPRVRDIASAIADLLGRGGKRLRPAFVHWGHAATGAAPDRRVTSAGAAIELLHTFALVHDDVMDCSPLRRGEPATHVALARSYPGSSSTARSRFGANAAILAGDLAYLWADELFDEVGAGEAVERARARFHQLRAEVIAGQYLDLHLAVATAPLEADAQRVALLKTARYTVTRPLQLGAALGSGSAQLDDVLGVYGDATGLAFQMRDDVLGLFGDPSVTGKSGLDDLREGKRTLLMLRALHLADDPQRDAIHAALGDPGVDEERATRCRQAVAASGALASVESLIADQCDAAVSAIAGLVAPAREALTALATFASYRQG